MHQLCPASLLNKTEQASQAKLAFLKSGYPYCKYILCAWQLPCKNPEVFLYVLNTIHQKQFNIKIILDATLDPLVYHTAIVYRYSGPSVILLLVLNMRQILGNFFYCDNCHSKSHGENLFRDNKIVSSFQKPQSLIITVPVIENENLFCIVCGCTHFSP